MRRRFGMAAASVALLGALVALPAAPVAAMHFDEMQKYEVASEDNPDGFVCTNNAGFDMLERAFWMDGDVPGEPSPNEPFFLNDLEVILEIPFGVGFDPAWYDEATLTVLGGQEIALSDPESAESFDDDAMWIIWTVPSALLAAPDTVGTHPIVPESFSYVIEDFALTAECDGFEDVGFAEVTVVGPDQGPEGPPGPEGPEGPEGPPGADGTPGTDGEDGADGVDGEDGADGRDGVDGADGADGADGVGGLVGVGTAGAATAVGAAPTFTG